MLALPNRKRHKSKIDEYGKSNQILATGEATGFIPAPGNNGKPSTIIGPAAIRDAVDARSIEQALNSRGAPGVTDLVLKPEAYAGDGAPVGCVLVSPTHVYPGPVGVDIKCSMSLLQLDLPVDAWWTKRFVARSSMPSWNARRPAPAKVNASPSGFQKDGFSPTRARGIRGTSHGSREAE